ncbi:MAG: hypothetical protein A3F16_04640 [Deltaproteobacteria bacterium RIFCSPHIGHO2_12_FULL_43_9]|nr:MAG: hypothetical protein A3F16_04640 [Deltaproteobacteria bacterium RIFCSPHIGHO2_12_FULL_43_9]
MKLLIFPILTFLLLGCVEEAMEGLESKNLGSGIKLFVFSQPILPTTSYFLVVQAGSTRDPAGKEGLANLTIEMLLRGTVNRNREKILEDIDYLGASLSAIATYDTVQLAGTTLSRTQDKFIELLSDLLLHPTFPAEEFEKLKSETIGQLQLLSEDDRSLNKVRFTQFLFHGHPLGRLTSGTPESIKSITLDDVKEFYKKYFVDGNVILAAAGDIEKGDLVDYIEEYISELPEGEIEPFSYPALTPIAKSKILLVDKPERTQTQILLGYYGVAGDSPDYYPLYVANNAFGGTFTARLMQEVRVARGWSYGAYSKFARRKSTGEFFTWTFPAVKDTIPTIELTQKLLDDLSEKGLNKDEFNISKNYSVRETAFDTETPTLAISRFLEGYIMGWKGYPADHRKKLEGVTGKDVENVIKKYFHSKPFVMTIVCTASDIKKGLEEKYPDAQIVVVPYNKWDVPS